MNLSLSPEKILSVRELLVLRLIGQGCSTKDISVLLLLPEHTIETYRKNINEKLGARHAADAVYKARILNLI